MSLRYKCHKSKFNINRKAVLRIKLLLIVFYPVWMRLYPMFVVVQFPSHVQLFVTPWTAAHQASLSFTISQSLLKLMSIESMMPSNHLILCHRLLLLPSVFSRIKGFSYKLALGIKAKVLELQLHHQSFQ